MSMSMTVSQDGASLGNVKMSTMSFTQEGLWLLDQLEPGSAINTLTATVEVSSALLPSVLETSLNLLVERHEILRTTLRMQRGTPGAGDRSPPAHPAPGDRPARAQRRPRNRLRLSAWQPSRPRPPFVLSQGPLLRCTLLHLTSEQSLLLLHLHRIVCDDWSVALLVRELACLYDACAAGQPSPLPPLPWQYADFATWQRQELQRAGPGPAPGLLASAVGRMPLLPCLYPLTTHDQPWRACAARSLKPCCPARSPWPCRN